ALLALPYGRARAGYAQSATAWLTAILLTGLLPLMQSRRGFDIAAPVAYVGLLLLVGLHGSARLLAGTLLAVCASLTAGYLLQTGAAVTGEARAFALTSLLATCLIVTSIAVMVWV